MKVLNKILRNLLSRIGIDKAIGFTIGGNLIQAVGSIVSLSLIALFLTKEEQGFYYTFGSILAIQVFFQLGFDGIITQYAAHETAHISTYNVSQNEIEQKAQSRLSSLLHFCIRWFSSLSIGLFVLLMIVGYVFFSKYGHGSNINWEWPWVILVVNTCFAFVITPLFSFLQGLGRVKEMAKIRMVQQSVNLVILWTMLSIGGKLYSAPIAGMISLLVALSILLFSEFRAILLKIWKLLDKWKVNYREEIFPYQWKIAISWISGYFIFQLFNPVLFATSGAIVAGQMGMTLTLINGIQSLSGAWLSTKIPLYSKLIALKSYKNLDDIFDRTLKQSFFTIVFMLAVLIVLIYLIRYFHIVIHGIYFGDRVLPYLPMFFMIGAIILNQYVFSWANYLRCHKKEPYLIMSISTAILCVLSTTILGKYFGVNGMTIGYFSITFVTFVWAYLVFLKKKHEWHT